MSVRAVFEVAAAPAPRSARGRVFARYPALRQESTTYAIPAADVSFGHHRVTGPPEAVEELLAATLAIAKEPLRVVVHYRAAGEAVFTHIGPANDRSDPAWDRRVEAVAGRVLGAHRYFVERVVGTGERVVWTLVTENAAALPAFLREVGAHCAAEGRAFRVRSIRPFEPGEPEAPDLTARQRDALLAAWAAGYYTGSARVADVAAAVGMSPSGFHGLLQRAERTIIGAAVARATTATRTPSPSPPPRARRAKPPPSSRTRGSATRAGAGRGTRRRR